MDLLGHHDALLCDLDGVVYLGPRAIPAAVTTLAAARQRGVATGFVTNNAGRSSAEVADHLADLGVAASADQVITSGMAAAALLARRLAPGAPVLVVGSTALERAVADEGLRPASLAEVLADPASSGVIQGFSNELRWSQLNDASRGVSAGAVWVAANLDTTRPTDVGVLPGTGMMVHAVQVATGRRPEVAGKPHRPVYDAAVRRSGGDRPLFAGDRLDTDIAGARAAGLATMWVLSGAMAPSAVLDADPRALPDHVGWDLAQVLAPPVEASLAGTGAGGERAGCGAVTVAADGTTAGAVRDHLLDALRCVIALRRAGVAPEPLSGIAAGIDAAWQAHREDAARSDATASEEEQA